MSECAISNSDLATAFTSSSVDGEAAAGTELKKRKTHRLKQRFQVVKKLGQGTYGKVQLAINNETGQEVAIKTIKKSKVSSQQDLVRIRREIQIMSSINHPNIIHIFEVFENKDKIVLVMQYASGGELYDYVSYRKVLNDSEARRVFRQIATAIYYCHKNKICHRDLKLENILLDEKGNAKIADFGLSNVFDDKHFLQTFCGSPLYASPEIVRGLPYFGPEVDCWSLGVLLYTLVYGAMPFDGSNFKKLVKQISEANYFEPPEKSAASGLIHKLLTPDPKERASIIDICTDEWVNQDSEHCLLQVAEDLSNLTKHAVRLDMLLALAPGSPGVATATAEKPPPITKTGTKVSEVETVEDGSPAATKNKRPNENVTGTNDSLAELAGKKTTKKKSKKSSNKDSGEKSGEQVETGKMSEISEQQEQQSSPKTPVKTKPIEDKSMEEIPQKQTSEDISNNQKTEEELKTPLHGEQENQKSNELTKNNESQTSLKSNESAGSMKRRGRVSIPKIWDEKESSPLASPKSTGSDGKRETMAISPGLFSVSELKKELEQKTKLNQQQITLNKRRDTLADTSELKLNKTNTVDNVKKYKNRSLSLNLNAIENNLAEKTKLLEKQRKDIEEKQQTVKADDKEKVITGQDIEKTMDEDDRTTSKTSSNSSIKDDKSLAKQIIQKNIAKAKLMEKRQTSVPSGETTPLISIENSTISVMQGSPTITSNTSSASNIFFKKANESKDFGTGSEVASLPQTAAAPITRSYKKVIFTKDGAKITETGKFYTHEGDDGVTTRVEKKSRITHIINSNVNPAITNAAATAAAGQFNIQRSDSQSSTGSIDIFDDIFDDHWTGDNLFSNVKSLFNDFFGRGRNEKLSLRSRAESLERTNFFPGAKSSADNIKVTERKLHQTSSKDSTDIRSHINSSSNNIFGSQKSLFSKSIFSNSSFSKSFGKEFNFDDMKSSARSIIDDYKNHSLIKDRFSGDDRDSFFTKRSNIFDEADPDTLETMDPINRRRVEQWLDTNESGSKDNFDNCMNTYGTIRPRTRRYSRTMTSNDYKSDIIKKVEVSNSSCHVIKQKTSTIRSENVLPRNADIQLSFTLDDLGGNLVVNQASVSVDGTPVDRMKKMASSTTKSSTSSMAASDLKLEEPSSLLEQLRTHGYKKLVNRRLSDSSSTEDIPQTMATTTSGVVESSSTVSNKSSALAEDKMVGESVVEKSTSLLLKKMMASRKHFDDDDDDDVDNNQEQNGQDGKKHTESLPEINYYNRRNSNRNLMTNSSLNSLACESVQERIHRKSYYSRFNEQINNNAASTRPRRRSVCSRLNHSDYYNNYNHNYGTKSSILTSSSLTSGLSSYLHSSSISNNNIDRNQYRPLKLYQRYYSFDYDNPNSRFNNDFKYRSNVVDDDSYNTYNHRRISTTTLPRRVHSFDTDSRQQDTTSSDNEHKD